MISLIITGWDLSTELHSQLEKLLAGVTSYKGVISVKVSSSGELAKLNCDYAGIDNATDVLSFSYVERITPEETTSDTALADIAISKEHITQQAKAANTDENTEFVLLLVHGALHAVGFDHQDYDGCQEMDRHQRTILEGLGLAYRDFGWLDG